MTESNGRAWSPDISEIGDRIAALTVSKAVELGDYLETVHKIKPAASGPVMMPQVGPAQPTAVVEPPKDEFNVMLTGYDEAKKINVIKVIRELTGLGLKEAKDAVEGSKNAPKAVKKNLQKADAEKVKKQLEDAGAKVELK